MDRWKIEHIKVHLGDALQGFLGSFKGAAFDSTICAYFGAFTAREEFVPSPYKCAICFGINWIEYGFRSEFTIRARRCYIKVPNTYSGWANFGFVAVGARPVFTHLYPIYFNSRGINENYFNK